MRYILRLWLPDKPGALGRVATAIGSVGASLVGIDILEQDGGWAIDELVVEAVDSENAEQKLIAALHFVDGVQIESILESPEVLVDPRVSALETAVELVEQKNAPALMELLVKSALIDLTADWSVLVKFENAEPLAISGNAPSTPWIKAFVAGSRTMRDARGVVTGPEDIAWTELNHVEAALVLGRDGRPFRLRERQQLDALARIADCRLSELTF